MGLVTDIMTQLDATVANVGGRYFEATAAAVNPTLTILVTLLFLIVGVFMSIGAYNMTGREGVQIIFRVGLVFLFVQSWANFNVFYSALTDAGNSLAMKFFSIAGTGNLAGKTTYGAMDTFAKDMGDTTDGALKAVGSIARGFLGAILYVFLAFLMAAYVLIVGYAKIMIAFLLGVAPLAMVCTIFDKTKTYFEAWLGAFIGYLLYPVAASAIIATVVTVAGKQVVPQGDADTVDAILGFFVVCIVGIGALFSIPKGVQHITGQIHLADFTPGAMKLTGRATAGTGSLAANSVGLHGLAHPVHFARGAMGLHQKKEDRDNTKLRSAHEGGQHRREQVKTHVAQKLAAMRSARNV